MGTPRHSKQSRSIIQPSQICATGSDYSSDCQEVPANVSDQRKQLHFQKNTTNSSSMSHKFMRKSLIGRQQPLTLIDTSRCATADSDDFENSESISKLSYNSILAISNNNLCDDEKLSLSQIGPPSYMSSNASNNELLCSSTNNYCTLPRRPKSTVCSFHTIIFEKGPGKKSLGFTIVGGRDSPRGALGIFIKSILATGQAIDDGRLQAGDEILAVNGHVCHDLSHEEAVKLFKGVKHGEVSLNICRRHKQNNSKSRSNLI